MGSRKRLRQDPKPNTPPTSTHGPKKQVFDQKKSNPQGSGRRSNEHSARDSLQLEQEGMPALTLLGESSGSLGCFFLALRFGSTWHTPKPHLGAFLCSWAKKQLWGCGGLEGLDPAEPRGAVWSCHPRRISSAGLAAQLSQPPHALAPGPVPSSDAPVCLSFPPCTCLIWADEEFWRQDPSPPDVQRQELARAQLRPELQPQGATLELLLWITVKKRERKGGEEKKAQASRAYEWSV